MIELAFLTTDPDDIERCRRYWELDGDGTFTENLDAVREPGSRGATLDRGFFGAVLARDTRRRCPLCGIPRIVHNREAYLAPIETPTPCYECQHVNQHLARSMRAHSAGPSGDSLWEGSFSFPVAAIALVHALGQAVHRRELRNGFTIFDCAGFAPAHLHRLLGRLAKVHIIEKLVPSTKGRNVGSATRYRITSDPALEQDLARFSSLLTEGTSFNHHGLMDLWLDYAVAECVAYVCVQSALFSLPIDPEDEQLCSALRISVNTCSIGEVWSESRHAIQVAVGLVEHGVTAKVAVATIPTGIARYCSPSLETIHMPEPIPRSISDQRMPLRDWFDEWYGICEYTRGKDIADLFDGLHNTRTLHKAVTTHGNISNPLGYARSQSEQLLRE